MIRKVTRPGPILTGPVGTISTGSNWRPQSECQPTLTHRSIHNASSLFAGPFSKSRNDSADFHSVASYRTFNHLF
ncbi:hypothetical protein CPC08DRAFT_553042 [Agrocybe pediades]|nr:hypothetical protein CPC08DRAFT_553042 [Agrocybe pediades]